MKTAAIARNFNSLHGVRSCSQAGTADAQVFGDSLQNDMHEHDRQAKYSENTSNSPMLLQTIDFAAKMNYQLLCIDHFVNYHRFMKGYDYGEINEKPE
jgi:hypothetical protein